MPSTKHSAVSLDDLYIMTAHMYSQRNAERPVSATLNHFLEVSAALTAISRQKRREHLDMAGALCKAIGWFFPLMAKLNVRSVEQLIFRKYPYVCPYCRRAPHVERICKLVKGTEGTVNHSELRKSYRDNLHRRPVTLDDWRNMFDQIYPREIADVQRGRSVIGLFEEIGELAEAVRVFDEYPKYLAGEAADVFSYIMGVANEYALDLEQRTNQTFSLQDEYLKRYPGLCVQCGFHICICPPLPKSTIGRLAKELDLDDDEELFVRHHGDTSAQAARIADRVLATFGWDSVLLSEDGPLPFDRGDANRSLVLLFMKLADQVAELDAGTASSLRSAAVRVASQRVPAGSREHNLAISQVLGEFRALPQSTLDLVVDGPSLAIENEAGGRLDIAQWRVLVATSGPLDRPGLALAREAREIRESIDRSLLRGTIAAEYIQAARIKDLRRQLLENTYDIVHIAGHGEGDGPLLEDENGRAKPLNVDALRQLIGLAGTVKCLVLSSCYSADALQESIAGMTVASWGELGDQAAVAFAQGFYDALGAGKDLQRCATEGRVAALAETDDPESLIIYTRAEGVEHA